MMVSQIKSSSTKGFSLLEMTLAIGVVAILMGGIFGLATGALELTSDVQTTGDLELARHRLIDTCRAHIEGLPSSASLQLQTTETGTSNQLVMHNHPLAFSFGSQLGLTHSVVLSTEPDGAGGLMVKAHYLDSRGAEDLKSGREPEALAIHSLILMRGIRELRWEFLDESGVLNNQGRKWVEEWTLKNGRPRVVALNLQLLGDQESAQLLFGIPRRRTPSLFQLAPTPSEEESLPTTEGDAPSAETQPDTEDGSITPNL